MSGTFAYLHGPIANFPLPISGLTQAIPPSCSLTFASARVLKDKQKLEGLNDMSKQDIDQEIKQVFGLAISGVTKCRYCVY